MVKVNYEFKPIKDKLYRGNGEFRNTKIKLLIDLLRSKVNSDKDHEKTVWYQMSAIIQKLDTFKEISQALSNKPNKSNYNCNKYNHGGYN